MATKEDWKDYFETVNGRPPTIDEFTAAAKNGEFDREAVAVSQPQSQPTVQAQQLSQAQTQYQAPMQPQRSAAPTHTLNSNQPYHMSANKVVTLIGMILFTVMTVWGLIESFGSFSIMYIYYRPGLLQGFTTNFANPLILILGKFLENFNLGFYIPSVVLNLIAISLFWIFYAQLDREKSRGFKISFLIVGILGILLPVTTWLVEKILYSSYFLFFSITTFISPSYLISSLPYFLFVIAFFLKSRVKPRVQYGQPYYQAPAPSLSIADDLTKFKSLLDQGIITQTEYDEQKRKLLG